MALFAALFDSAECWTIVCNWGLDGKIQTTGAGAISQSRQSDNRTNEKLAKSEIFITGLVNFMEFH